MDRPLPPDPPPVPPTGTPPVSPVPPVGGLPPSDPPPVSPPGAVPHVETLPAPTDGRARLPVPRTSASPTLDPDATVAPESRMLPPHVGKAGRIGDHLAALSADMREWTELRIALVQRKVEGVVGIFERIQHFVPALKFYIPAAVLAVVGALFVLVTMAIGIGALLDAYWAGFLIVTVLLLGLAGVLFVLGRKMQTSIEAEVAAAKREKRGDRDRNIDDVQAAQRASVRQSVS